jgi:hypothetical protein
MIKKGPDPAQDPASDSPLKLVPASSAADPHHFDTDPDPAFHFDPDPDPTFHSDLDPDPTIHFDPDPDPTTHLPPS